MRFTADSSYADKDKPVPILHSMHNAVTSAY